MMKHLTSLILLSTLISVSACKKKTIKVQGVTRIESGTSARLNKVSCNGGICIVCGGERFLSAEILRSADNGNSWTFGSYPDAGKGMYGMGRTPAGTLYLSGVDGKVLMSKDNGITWSIKQIPYWNYYLSATCPSENRLMFANTAAQNYGNVLRIDSSFNVIDTTFFKFGLNEVEMVNTKVGYLAGYGAVLKTIDGGDNWTYLDVKNDNFNGICALDENQVWVCGYGGSIFRTRNGGGSWERLINGNNMLKKQYSFLGIYFKDSQNGWVFGEKGVLLGTTDGGDNWKAYESFTKEAIRDATMAPDGGLITVGDNGNVYKLAL
ncbi:MAG: hypothetical protein H6551_12945 [Chitinophagales bacterium]|nr:hypothetical protein [Chitinophagaceae bacterium]MCB9066039.1 hypothetical protein [Chitinophagales bacterium]